jgi:glyoxylase-like metal-dependent hydrolase (beta-lactamase superfamily II)
MTISHTNITRRQMLARTTAAAGGLLIANHPLAAWWQAQPDLLAQRRAQSAAIPITTRKLADNLLMLSGPGGNVAVLTGPDGLIVVDTFVQPAWPALKKTLDGLGVPVKAAIDTHWHYDHADNNAPLRRAGAAIIAHANTAKRLSQRLEVLGMTFEPVPEAARPTQTFTETHRLTANGENVELAYIPPSHTDTDIYIRFPRANVLHLGDTYFSSGYPFFDVVTQGNIGGMIEAANRGLKLADASTKIIPGHGPLGDMKTLTAYRDMLVSVRDRVQKLKRSGRTLDEVVKEKPTGDLDAVWGKAFMMPDMFVTLVYNTL